MNEKRRQSVKKYNDSRKQSLYKMVKEYKEILGCEYCRESSSVCLDLIWSGSGEKPPSISDLICRYKVSSEELDESLSSYTVICANCSRKLKAGINPKGC